MTTKSFNNCTIRQPRQIVKTTCRCQRAGSQPLPVRSGAAELHRHGTCKGREVKERGRRKGERARHHCLDSMYCEERPRTFHSSIFCTRRASSRDVPSLSSAANNLLDATSCSSVPRACPLCT